MKLYLCLERAGLLPENTAELAEPGIEKVQSQYHLGQEVEELVVQT